MTKYTKENHLEISDGDTMFLSVKQCPLTEVEVDINPAIVYNNKVVCCINSNTKTKCQHFYKIILTNNKTKLQCALMGDPVKEPLEFVEIDFCEKK